LDFIAQIWNSLPALPRTLVAFALVLGVLVFVHEMGH
jgi:regulator of sigma E protease